ncbi:(2Fe-2S)-binding protein [Haloechinothrix halophila]|uniref:(2Fe-2S)-binding protein n=1 Tax=Haloechinothrix halophila TaxID=1069073 RepID=UPI0004294819|nr:(2Fe-2S)-binding protein [Haloechinothrix halophila]
MTEFSAVLITDPEWMSERLRLARALYGSAPNRVLGTVWWYSTSSVLVAPPLEALLHTGRAVDPALDAVTLQIHPDGRLVDAHSSRPFNGDASAMGQAMGAALAAAITSVSSACGASERALWAIAADSIANRALWAGQAVGDVDRALAVVDAVSDGIGSALPRPRFERYGERVVVRRVSCCLIDKATGLPKCASCPNQHPDERAHRIRAALP